jgi:hypothetical protein
MDIWKPSLHRPVYTHFTSSGEARRDTIYTTANLFQKKTGAEILFAPFTDHLAVAVRLTLDIRMARREKGTWKLNNTILQDPPSKEMLLEHIAIWKTNQRRYDSIEWWDSYVKTKIKHLFLHMGAERGRDMRDHENFSYQCIYDAIQNEGVNGRYRPVMNRCKAQLLLHKRKMDGTTLNIQRHACLKGETHSISLN